ncbi:MAG: hypothetical protein ABR600_12515 [Actinomycetota bacterium]
MKAEFSRNGSVATATWDGGRAVVKSDDPSLRETVQQVFRPTPVVVQGAGPHASAEAVLQPGSVEWFRAAAFSRAEPAGLSVRVVPEVVGKGGWDPAAAYRTFRQSMADLIERDAERRDGDHQPGEEGPVERAETGDQPRDSDAPPTVQ